MPKTPKRRSTSSLVTKRELAEITKRLNAKYGWKSRWNREGFGKRVDVSD